MLQTKSLSGTYKYEDFQIEVMPYFTYEVSLYIITSTRANILSSRYYISNKLLKVPYSTVVKKFKKFNIVRFITLLGTPESFIRENNLQKYELYRKKKKL